MKGKKVLLYGHFGTGNIGNDSSFEAALHNVKKYLPNAEIICVCSGPREITRRFGIQALSMSGTHANEPAAGGIISRIKRLSLRLNDEISFWLKRPSWFQPGDLFIVVGTGAVDDMAVRRPWHAPYELYKWCKTAKLGGARVIFLNVGVGPIVNRVSRFLMLKALRMADYRSYREQAAFDYLHGIGYNTSGDRLYPDVVFSLSKESLPEPKQVPITPQVIGLGLINYYGWRHDPALGDAVHREYFSKIKQFAAWLFSRGYTIRVISGDRTDWWPVREFVEFVNKEGNPDWRTGMIVRIRSEKRNAKAFCRLAEKCLTRSARRKRRVIIVVDRARIHTPEGSRLVAELLKKYARRLRLRYVPSYSPECMPMEIFWNDWRDQVTHNHDRLKIKDLERDSDCYFAHCAHHPNDVLRRIGSPFAKRCQNRKH